MLVIFPLAIGWLDGLAPWPVDIQLDSLLGLAVLIHLVCGAAVTAALYWTRRPGEISTGSATGVRLPKDDLPVPVSALAA